MGPKKMMGALKRVVIDTNVLVSALLFDGVPGELIECWRQGKILPLASRDIINEFIRVLSYPKFQLNEEEIKFLLNKEILPWFEIVIVKKQNMVANKYLTRQFMKSVFVQLNVYLLGWININAYY